MNMTLTRFAVAAAQASALLALAACGGGNGNSTGNDAPSGAAPSDSARALAATQTPNFALMADPSGPNLIVRAAATLALNVGPLMQLRVNGTVVASVEVRASSAQDYSFTVPAIAAGDRLDVVFNNDLNNNGEDRNLSVHSVTVNGTAMLPTDAGVTLDRGVGAQAFDGIDVLPGQRGMLWNGALRFTVPAAPVVTAGLSPSCASFYAARPGFALNADRTVVNFAPLAKPAKGASFAEPNFGTCLTRATNHAADGLIGYARTEYSRRQMFNADNTRQLIVSADGFFYIYDANTHAVVKKLPSFDRDPEIQWHPTNPDLIYLMPSYGSEMQQKEMNVVTGTVRVVGDFRARLQALFPNATPTNVYTRAEGSPSRDGRYWCYMVRDAVHTTGGNWGSLGVFTWDRDTDTILGSIPLNGEVPDHVSMSPTGNYCVVSSEGSLGETVYSRNMTQPRKVFHKSEHSDLALDADGNDVLVYIDSTSYGDVYSTKLSTGERTTLMTGVRTAAHFSGKAFNKPGWIVMTTQVRNADSYGAQWMQEKVMAVQIKANPTVYNLAFHRTAYAGENTAPTASVNRDFTRITFNSNWQVNSATDVDTYTVEIPANALVELATTPTTPNPNPNPNPTPTPTPTPSPLTIAVGPVTRDSYKVTYTATTNLPATCGSAWSAGMPFAYLYDFLTKSANGLTHSAEVYLDTPTAPKTIYLVCKHTNSTAEKEVAIQVN
ncbi:MAG: hypothetical protein RLZZ618_288 [Pseudomonadota bacterium]